MKQLANNVSRMQKEIKRLKDEISMLENDLSHTGSTKTIEDLQTEIEAISGEMYVLKLISRLHG